MIENKDALNDWNAVIKVLELIKFKITPDTDLL